LKVLIKGDINSCLHIDLFELFIPLFKVEGHLLHDSTFGNLGIFKLTVRQRMIKLVNRPEIVSPRRLPMVCIDVGWPVVQVELKGVLGAALFVDQSEHHLTLLLV
jgi:hypothetical protein